jgi:hypothetical protein
MSKNVTLKLDTQLPGALEFVAQDGTLNRAGDAVARIDSVASIAREDAEDAVRRLLEFREAHRVSTEEFWDILKESRPD